MAIKLQYDSEDAIPEGFEALYTEKDGKWALTEIEGLKTDADVQALKETLQKERTARREAEKRAKAFGDLDADGLQEKLDRLEELEALADTDPAKLDEKVEAKIRLEKSKFERDLAKLQKERDELTSQVDNFKSSARKSRIEKALRDAATSKVNEHAIDDVLARAHLFDLTEDGDVITRDGVEGVTPGVAATDWLSDALNAHPHWGRESAGAGANGGSGSTNNTPDGVMSMKGIIDEAFGG